MSSKMSKSVLIVQFFSEIIEIDVNNTFFSAIWIVIISWVSFIPVIFIILFIIRVLLIFIFILILILRIMRAFLLLIFRWWWWVLLSKMFLSESKELIREYIFAQIKFWNLHFFLLFLEMNVLKSAYQVDDVIKMNWFLGFWVWLSTDWTLLLL